jgi:ParB family chromosome partitioning protein
MSNIQSAANLKHAQIMQRLENDQIAREENDQIDRELNIHFSQYIKAIGKNALIPIADITIEENCRKTMDHDSPEFLQLMESIKNEGILQNLVIEIKLEPEIKLLCISGQRRLTIAKQLGIEKVPCLLKAHTSSSASLIRSLDENILRKNLTPVDLAESYLNLLSFDYSVEQISKKYEKDSRTVQYYINIAKFPEEAKSIIRENPSLFTVRVLLNEFAKKKWETNSVLLKAIKKKLEPQTISETKNNDYTHIEEKVLQKTGLQVKLQRGKNVNSGKFYLSFSDQEELNKILEILGIS